MKFLYLAVVVMLLVVTVMAGPECKGQRSCHSLGGVCGKNCDKLYVASYACDCSRRGLYCCRPHKKG